MTTRRGITLIELLIVIAFLGLLIAMSGAFHLFEVAARLAMGWFLYPINNAGNFTIEWTSVGIATIAAGLFVWRLHALLAQWWGRRTQTRWHFRKTLGLVAGLLCLSAAGIALISIAHQVIWLSTSDEPMVESTGRKTSPRHSSANNLKWIGLALHDYREKSGALPAGGTYDETGQAMHSWQTLTLPDLDQPALYNNIDRAKPWNDPGNRKVMSTTIETFVNPRFPLETYAEHNAEGYGLSHYAGNVRVLPPGRSLTSDDITDGLANTILAGEVGAGFKPWGDPANLRDPALGLKVSPNTFGFSDTVTTTLLLGDGAVRFFNPDTDPAILRALATPKGGEDVSHAGW